MHNNVLFLVKNCKKEKLTSS